MSLIKGMKPSVLLQNVRLRLIVTERVLDCLQSAAEPASLFASTWIGSRHPWKTRNFQMIRNPLVVLALFLSSASLPGCSFVRDSVIDSVAGAPVTNVAKDVKATSDEYEKGQSEKRAEELSKDYEDFLRSRDAPSGCENETTQSVMIQCGTNERE